MGIIRMGAPTALILHLKNQFPLRNFVETGTFTGGTSVWAASHFEQVITVENSRIIYDKTVAAHGHIPNIKFHFGHSAEVLRQVVPTLESPALFWLDSHWCGGDSYGKDDECPIMEELEIINASSQNHFLLIDDARLFTSPPPRPSRLEEWPSIDQVIDGAKAGLHEKYIAIFEDVIIVVPQSAQNVTALWLQTAATQAWSERRKMSSRLRRGIGLISEGVSLLGQGALAKVRTTRF